MSRRKPFRFEKHYGLRIVYFCLTNLLVTRESWCTSKDLKLLIYTAFIDFRKAFGKVTRNQLLVKLSIVGVAGNLLL